MPPSITAQPQDASVPAGNPATFSVTATGSSPLSYQWTQNGVSIPGATSSSYTIQSTTLQMDGLQFRVDVTNNSGSVMSSVATLHVLAVP